MDRDRPPRPPLLYGLDFTSAPSRRKPITLAGGRIEGGRLILERLDTLPDWAAFEAFLDDPAPKIAGFDLPLGMPLPLREHFGRDTAALAAHALERGPIAWVGELRRYRGPNGERELFRPCDRAARACSPMKGFYIPVARMYAQGAGRIRRAGWRVAWEPGPSERIAVEAYPALVAEAVTGDRSFRSYKSDTSPRPDHRPRREAIVAGLARPNAYGFTVENLPADLANDPGADRLDAVLALLQTAWASGRTDLGVPPGTDPFEGSISDPALLGTVAA